MAAVLQSIYKGIFFNLVVDIDAIIAYSIYILIKKEKKMNMIQETVELEKIKVGTAKSMSNLFYTTGNSYPESMHETHAVENMKNEALKSLTAELQEYIELQEFLTDKIKFTIGRLDLLRNDPSKYFEGVDW